MSNKFNLVTKSPIASVCLLGLSALLLAGCAQIRLLTYPTSFTWIGEGEVESTMQSMAESMANLNQWVANESTTGENSDDVLAELENIEYLAASLSVRTPANDSNLPATNHLLIDENMDQFLESILRARVQVEETPANYYGVGQLTGSCMACHRFR